MLWICSSGAVWREGCAGGKVEGGVGCWEEVVVVGVGVCWVLGLGLVSVVVGRVGVEEEEEEGVLRIRWSSSGS